MVQRHYRGEADKDVYYRMPKMLFLNPRYKPMSIGAKALYGILLDRMGLSNTNERFTDKDGSVYIYFRQEQAMEMLNVKGTQKIVQLYKELEEAELIERVKQGFGKPDKIYVGKIEIYSEQEDEPTPDFDFQKSEGTDPNRVLKIKSKDFENQKQSALKIKTLPNKTEMINLESINQSAPEASATTETSSESAGFAKEEIETQVAAQIDKQALYETYPQNRATIDSIAALMVDELTSDRPAATIGGATRTRAEIRVRLSAVTTADIAAIIDNMKKNPPKMKNPRGYLLTCLYNAPAMRIADAATKHESEVRKYANALMRRRQAEKAKRGGTA